MGKIYDGIDIENIEKFDKLGGGVYNLKLRDGTNKEISLKKQGEAVSFISAFKKHNRDRVSSNSDHVSNSEGNKPSAPEKKISKDEIRKRIDRNFGGWRDSVVMKNLEHKPFWPTEDKVNEYLNLGYVLANKNDVENFVEVFSNLNPGEALSPNGRLAIHGHVLMYTSAETQQAILDHYYEQRPKQHFKTNKMYKDPRYVNRENFTQV